MRELKRCQNCGNWMMMLQTKNMSDDDVERLKYCDDCRKNMGHTKTTAELEEETRMRFPTARDVEERDELIDEMRKKRGEQNN
jgi:protein-arginine kinase activator protein McsA